MPSPPESFKRRLAAYDPDLRVRWSENENAWSIEYKMPQSLIPIPPEKLWMKEGSIDICVDTPLNHDRRVWYRDGYWGLLYTKNLTDGVLKAISEADRFKIPMADAVRRVHEEEEQEAKEKHRKELEMYHEGGKDVWDAFKHLENPRRTVTVPDMPKKEITVGSENTV